MDGDKTPINNDSLSAGSSDGTASTVEDEKKTKETTGSGGHDNPAFEVDEKKSNASTSSSSQHEDNSATTVNLELVDLTPPKMSPKSAKSMAAEDAIDADVEKGKKKEKDNLDYFVPVNEHKKGVRGEKLYITKDARPNDRRRKSRCRKCFCATLGTLCVLGVVVIAVLVGVGIIDPLPQLHKLTTTSNKDDAAKSNEIIDEAKPVTAEVFHPDAPNVNEIPTTEKATTTTTTSEFPSVAFPIGFVPNAFTGEFRMMNEWDEALSDESSRAFLDMKEKLEASLAEIFPGAKVDVVDFTQGSIVVSFRLTLADDGTGDKRNKESVKMILSEALAINDGSIADDLMVYPGSISIHYVPDLCMRKDEICSNGKCIFENNDFRCICPEGTTLNEDSDNCEGIFEAPMETEQPEPELESQLFETTTMQAEEEEEEQEEEEWPEIHVPSIHGEEEKEREKTPEDDLTAPEYDFEVEAEEEPLPEDTFTTAKQEEEVATTTTSSTTTTTTTATSTTTSSSSSSSSSTTTVKPFIVNASNLEENEEEASAVYPSNDLEEKPQDFENLARNFPDEEEEQQEEAVTESEIKITLPASNATSEGGFTDALEEAIKNVISSAASEIETTTEPIETSTTSAAAHVTNPVTASEKDEEEEQETTSKVFFDIDPEITTNFEEEDERESETTTTETTATTTGTTQVTPPENLNESTTTLAFVAEEEKTAQIVTETTTTKDEEDDLLVAETTTTQSPATPNSETVAPSTEKAASTEGAIGDESGVDVTTEMQKDKTTTFIYEDEEDITTTISTAEQSSSTTTAATTTTTGTTTAEAEAAAGEDKDEEEPQRGESAVPRKLNLQEAERLNELRGKSQDKEDEICPPKTTFECGSGECLPRIQRCDLIKDCLDGSDELECDSNECLEEEFQCRSGGRCLPPEARCDGREDCPAGEDEADCEAPCNDGFLCSSEARCIPAARKCDGRSDCANNEDEADCECAQDEFKCEIGGGCVMTAQLCDGYFDCADQSDEWNCLRIGEDSRIEVSLGNGDWSSVCGDEWTEEWSDAACQQLGFGSGAALTKKLALDSSSAVLNLNSTFSPNGSTIQEAVTDFADNETCSSVAGLECGSTECGKWELSDAQTDIVLESSDSVDTQEQWVSVGYLLHVNTKTSCTVSIIDKTWLVASHGCIAKAGDFEPVKWVLFAGPSGASENSPDGLETGTQIKLIKRFVHHPSTRFNQGISSNDLTLVELLSPLHFTPLVQAICLPEEDAVIGNETFCISAGWRIFKDEVSFHQYLTPITEPDIDLNICNSTEHYNGLLGQDAICSQTSSKHDPCKSDIGAPLMCTDETSGIWRLFGILTHKGQCSEGGRKHPDVYTSIAEHSDWIQRSMGR